MTNRQTKARASAAASTFAAFWLAGCAASAGLEARGTEGAEALDEDGGVPSDDESNLDKALQGSTCNDPIVRKPSSVQTLWPDIHTFTRYLKVDKYNLHVVGTASVSDWMMRESCLFNEAMVTALKDPAARAKLSGFIAHITTYKDKPINSKGQRSGGTYLATLTCEEMVCGVSPTDTYYPTRPKKYRDWVVPAHETGHAIELTLGLKERSDRIYEARHPTYDPSLKREYFAWGTQNWFGGSAARQSMPQWERNYLSSVFNAQNNWQPKCTR